MKAILYSILAQVCLAFAFTSVIFMHCILLPIGIILQINLYIAKLGQWLDQESDRLMKGLKEEGL